jgi:flagellum-specific peptidoglycan hydrolase FlgJ
MRTARRKIAMTKVPESKNKIKKIIGLWTAWVSVVVLAYVYGTFTPNKFAQQKTIRAVEQKITDQARYLGFRQPEFVYNDEKTFVGAVQKCVDYLNLMTDPHHRIPSAIIVGMAVIESDYGRSRFAIEGNALFGVRTWDPKVPQMKPQSIPNAQFGVKKYIHKCESVSDMISIINNHPAYEPFRIVRDRQYDTNIISYRPLMLGLRAWSTNPDYAEIILQKIKQLKLP